MHGDGRILTAGILAYHTRCGGVEDKYGSALGRRLLSLLVPFMLVSSIK
jgi:hypothetical protein